MKYFIKMLLCVVLLSSSVRSMGLDTDLDWGGTGNSGGSGNGGGSGGNGK